MALFSVLTLATIIFFVLLFFLMPKILYFVALFYHVFKKGNFQRGKFKSYHISQLKEVKSEKVK
jgi:hypothetical protein